jgi:hypothetical protein
MGWKLEPAQSFRVIQELTVLHRDFRRSARLNASIVVIEPALFNRYAGGAEHVNGPREIGIAENRVANRPLAGVFKQDAAMEAGGRTAFDVGSGRDQHRLLGTASHSQVADDR